LVFSLDGVRLFSSAEYDSAVRVWDMSTGKLLDSFPGYPFGINDLAISLAACRRGKHFYN
jgi:WD40 repeat protein